MRPLFVLRPEPGASATAERARALGLEPVLAPLFEVGPVDWSVPDPSAFDGLLLTSANAVRYGGEGLGPLRRLPVHAVGEATADAARRASFPIATVGSSDIDALLLSIPSELRLLHLCGVDRRIPSVTGPQVTAVPVYRSAPLPRPAPFDLIGGAVTMVHSPRAAKRLAELLSRERRRAVALAAISAAAAEAAGPGWETVEWAHAPNDRALLALAARLCDKPPQS